MARTAREEWRAGWPIAIIGTVGMAGGSIIPAAAGVFMVPFSERFGWSRASYSSGLTAMLLVAVVLMPVMGRLIDRFGSRPLALTGVFLHVCAIASLGFASGSVVQWVALCGFTAFAGTFISPAVWTAATASLFTRSRGLAIAVTTGGIGLASTLVPFLATRYLALAGPALAFPMIAATWGVLAIPLTLFFFHPARVLGRVAPSIDAERSAGYREALTSRAFVMLALAGALFGMIIFSMTVHLVPILRANGIDAGVAAAIMGLTGLFTMAGRVIGGALLDRFSARLVGAVAFLMPLATFALLLNVGASVPLSALAAITLGLASGAETDLIAFLVARHFGMRNFGGIYAASMAFASAAAAMGPLVAGRMYDLAGNYHGFLLVAMVPPVVCAALVVALPRPPARDAEPLAAPVAVFT